MASIPTRASLSDLPARVDLLVIGGGISGAGILHEATARGLSALLVERGDFASGTSSASSKLVHGGLRYLKQGQWRLTLESVRARDRLLRSRAGLVEPQPFLMPVYRGMRPGLATMRAGLLLYDLMGGHVLDAQRSRRLSAAQARAAQAELRSEGLLGALVYRDAATDDARLVLRLIFEARQRGAWALNYVSAERLLVAKARVHGAVLRDACAGTEREIEATLTVNATGAWCASDRFAFEAAAPPALRPLRGSHFLIPLARLPVHQAVGWLHPRDGRPVFVYPWQGAALYGTTDVDHDAQALDAPCMSAAEADYLLEGLRWQFPEARLEPADLLSSYAGVRPVVAGGKSDPSAESRESALWDAPGYLGITGGKLTTFERTARQVLDRAARLNPQLAPRKPAAPPMPPVAGDRLSARYGAEGQRWIAACGEAQEAIENTPYRWSELAWCARHEAVVHLDDLLLRRTRLGLLLPEGGAAMLDRVGDLCRRELGWDEPRWRHERARYLELWRQRHAVWP